MCCAAEQRPRTLASRASDVVRGRLNEIQTWLPNPEGMAVTLLPVVHGVDSDSVFFLDIACFSGASPDANCKQQ